MIEPLSRDELFALAEEPIGSRALQAGRYDQIHDPDLVRAAKRASKLWLPRGRRGSNSREAKDADTAIRSTQFDLEDAVEAAGGSRGGISS